VPVDENEGRPTGGEPASGREQGETEPFYHNLSTLWISASRLASSREGETR
jgi:hypothetical protein